MALLTSHHAIYAGSFDPLTLGHLDLIQRGAKLFDRLTVAVGTNPDKRPVFSPEERVELIREVVCDLPNVGVASFSGLTVDFAREVGAAVMIRGMRTLSDIESEFTMTLANRALAHDIETIFLMASEKYTYISSTLIRQVAQLGSHNVAGQLRDFVPIPVIAPLLRKYQRE